MKWFFLMVGLFALLLLESTFVEHETPTGFEVIALVVMLVVMLGFIGTMVWQGEQIENVGKEDSEIWLLEELYNENRRKT
jgi:hypothetical protein